ncbi:methyltransferase domain containing protein [Nitzschia inconspicua]|uniref:Methyltransferase domain containing protein n=1 Tax=Nitzschia inconspicua TaxID=303405 RepID=A0A9K3PWY0_9STRA|nr:methyltransferase domain containing protein [Nitzschia inconspicua]
MCSGIHGRALPTASVRLDFDLSMSTSNTKAFDFASPAEWDVFYRQQQLDEHTYQTPNTEWHDSVALEDIAAAVPPNSTCLVVGCGTSRLPQVLLQQPAPPRSLIMLDTSPTCLERLKQLYGDTCGTTTMDYVCGDATQLTQYFATSSSSKNKINIDISCTTATTRGFKSYATTATRESSVDIIVDKGLMDAILCSEGWDGPLERMLQEASQVLKPAIGQYLLISYQLPRTTREFLVEVGRDVGLEWEYDVDLSVVAQGRQAGDKVSSTDNKTTSGESRINIALATKIPT